jgi:hypothetical protein
VTAGAGGARLAVVVDGVPMAEDAARDMWTRFSAYMEGHRGDLGGFARSEGFVSAHPRSDGGHAVLVLSRSEPQEAYGAAPKPAGKRGTPRRRR